MSRCDTVCYCGARRARRKEQNMRKIKPFDGCLNTEKMKVLSFSAEKRKVPPVFSVTLQEIIMEAAPGFWRDNLAPIRNGSDLYSTGVWSRLCVRTQHHTLIEAIQPHGLLNVSAVCVQEGGLPATSAISRLHRGSKVAFRDVTTAQRPQKHLFYRTCTTRVRNSGLLRRGHHAPSLSEEPQSHRHIRSLPPWWFKSHYFICCISSHGGSTHGNVLAASSFTFCSTAAPTVTGQSCPAETCAACAFQSPVNVRARFPSKDVFKGCGPTSSLFRFQWCNTAISNYCVTLPLFHSSTTDGLWQHLRHAKFPVIYRSLPRVSLAKPDNYQCDIWLWANKLQGVT